jgi:hypothetical protein
LILLPSNPLPEPEKCGGILQNRKTDFTGRCFKAYMDFAGRRDEF